MQEGTSVRLFSSVFFRMIRDASTIRAFSITSFIYVADVEWYIYVHVMFMLLPSHFVLARNDLTLHPEVKAQVLAGGRGLGYFKELTDTTRVVVFLFHFLEVKRPEVIYLFILTIVSF